MEQFSNEMGSVFNDPNGDAQLPVPPVSGEPVGGHAEKESSPRIDAPDDSTPNSQGVSKCEPSAPMVAAAATEPTDALDDPTSADLAVEAGALATPAQGETHLCETSDALDDPTPSQGNPAKKTVASKASHPSPAANGLGRTIFSGDNIDCYLWTEFDVEPLGIVNLVKGADGRAYLVEHDHPNPLAHLIRSSMCNSVISAMAAQKGKILTQPKTQELNARLQALALTTELTRDVWYRVAPIEGGIVLDVGNAARTQLKITGDGIETLKRVEAIHHVSPILFRRTPTMKSLPPLVEEGDLGLLKKHVNLNDIDRTLFIAWLTYTMAHPKRDGTSYVILVIQGDQGSGKTSLCNNVIIPLIDPSSVGVQTFPKTAKDLGIVCENAHVACFDNVRNFKADTSDLLCMTSTRSTLSGRTLYSDSEQYVDVLHGAIVLNGIHSFVMQPDLAERCLTVYTKSLAGQYKTSATMKAELQADMPKIFRALLDCIVGILRAMPNAQTTAKERMADFVQWLAAWEASQGVPGVYQRAYAESLRESQYEMLRGNSLAAAVLEFAEGLKSQTWTGTPQQLLSELTDCYNFAQYRSLDLPVNVIALSKRLNALKASLRSQGIHVQLSRGKERKITIRVAERSGNDLHAT